MKIRYVSKNLSGSDTIIVATENRWQTYSTIELIELFKSSNIEDKISMFEKSDKDIKAATDKAEIATNGQDQANN